MRTQFLHDLARPGEIACQRIGHVDLIKLAHEVRKQPVAAAIQKRHRIFGDAAGEARTGHGIAEARIEQFQEPEHLCGAVCRIAVEHHDIVGVSGDGVESLPYRVPFALLRFVDDGDAMRARDPRRFVI